MTGGTGEGGGDVVGQKRPHHLNNTGTEAPPEKQQKRGGENDINVVRHQSESEPQEEENLWGDDDDNDELTRLLESVPADGNFGGDRPEEGNILRQTEATAVGYGNTGGGGGSQVMDIGPPPYVTTTSSPAASDSWSLFSPGAGGPEVCAVSPFRLSGIRVNPRVTVPELPLIDPTEAVTLQPF